MSIATPVDVRINPNNTDQRYTLYNNGRIDAEGGAPPAVIETVTSWFTRFEPPGVALHIENWTTGAGWVLDYRGGFNPINGATHPQVGVGDNPTAMSGIPITSGPNVRRYVDWSWDPAGTGQGYVLDHYGQLLPFGGATAPPRTGPRWTKPQAIRLAMRWTPDKRALTVNGYGQLFADFTGSAGEVAARFRWPRFGAVRDFVVMDWDAVGGASGYLLDLYGGMHEFGGRPRAYGFPYNNGGDMARCLAVISYDDPERFLQVWAGGQQREYVSSTPPTVTAGGVDLVSPSATVTDTTRPDLRWEYTDPQGDSQAAWQVLVFTSSFVATHSMTDPLTWVGYALVDREGIDRNARGIACPVDLPNGDYRLYVRARDTADQWSAWDNHPWTQNVPVPVAPTGLTAVANQATFEIALSAFATTGGSANLIRFEYSDDDEVTWWPVAGADAVTLATTTDATDRAAGLGVPRSYRAIAYATDPAVASAPSNTVTATLTQRVHVLTATEDPTAGGQVTVQEPLEWVRPVRAGVHQGLGPDAIYPTVLRDGRPKSRRTTLRLLAMDAATWDLIEGLAERTSTLVYRGPFGDVIYCKLVGDWPQRQVRAAPTVDEVTPLRHMHTTELPLVEVRPPHLGG